MAPKPLTSPLAVHAVRLRDESINALSVFDFCIHFSAFQRYEMAPKPLTSPLGVPDVRRRVSPKQSFGSVSSLCTIFLRFQFRSEKWHTMNKQNRSPQHCMQHKRLGEIMPYAVLHFSDIYYCEKRTECRQFNTLSFFTDINFCLKSYSFLLESSPEFMSAVPIPIVSSSHPNISRILIKLSPRSMFVSVMIKAIPKNPIR